MESEKVKKIKKYFEERAETRSCLLYKDKENDELDVICFADILTLINELESENERLQLENRVLLGKEIVKKEMHENLVMENINIQEKIKQENERLKNCIAELEKENEIKTDTITDLLNKQEFYEKDKLTKFAERLRGKAIRRQEFIGELAIDDIEYVNVKDIDKTLKEFIGK